MRPLAIAAIAALTATVTAPARADGERIALLGIEVIGDSDPTLIELVKKTIERAARERGMTLVGEAAECVLPDCARAATRAANAEVAVRFTVEAAGSTYTLKSWVVTDTDERTQESDCIACARSDLETHIAVLFTSSLKPPTVVVAESTDSPPSPTPAPTIDGGGMPEPRRFRYWKWVAAGSAAALLTTGIVLVAIDGPTCSNGGDVRCPEIRSSKESGLFSLGLGAASAGIAAWMFYRDSKDVKALPLLAPTDGGAIAGALVRF